MPGRTPSEHAAAQRRYRARKAGRDPDAWEARYAGRFVEKDPERMRREAARCPGCGKDHAAELAALDAIPAGQRAAWVVS